jgi:hypothetical protein
MQRLNLTIDETLYEQARAFSFVEKRPISQIIRDSLAEYFQKHTDTKSKADLILTAKDKSELLEIIQNDTFDQMMSLKINLIYEFCLLKNI